MTIIRIACGWNQPVTDDLGFTWAVDNSFTNGNPENTNLGNVTNTSQKTSFIFCAQRYGNFTYSIPIPNGNYSLQLGFAETYWSTAGSRTFNVSAQGNTILSAYDIIVRAGGRLIAKIESFPIVVSSGLVNLVFTAIVDNAMVSNIEIVPSVTNYRASPSMLLGA